jgi:hypothetical protein
MLRLCNAGIALIAAIGCSPVSDSSNVPDAPIDSTDTRPPEIASSIPANMSTKASVLTPVSVFFDEQLDPQTVTAATVKLGYNQAIPTQLFPFVDILKPHGPAGANLTQIKGTVSYDPAARKVSFVPLAPLPYGFVIVLSFVDVKDMGGVSFTGNITFMTAVNGQTKQYSYNPSTGVPNDSIVMPVDMNGRQTKRVGSSAPGADTIWFTADDPKNQHYEFKFSPDGRLEDERRFSIGGDNLWDTADDITNVCVRYAHNAERQTTERTYAAGGPGPDTVWCTADDMVTVNTVYQYMGPTMTGWVYNNTAGADGTWHTSDDRCFYYWEYIYDAQGLKTREILRACNGDGMPKTADDTFNYYYAYEYDASGNQTKFVYHGSAGPDTVWLNADDPPSYQDRYVRDANGLVTDHYRSNGAGPDMVWGNADDPGTHTVTTYNAQKLPDEVTFYGGPGGDLMWGTMDDVIGSYSKTTYDALGNRVDQKTYNAGADSVWKTPDDRVITDADFDLAH